MAQTDKPGIDWKEIEREYRAGKRSLRDIGSQYGVTETAIRKRAKKHGWVRDLQPKVDKAVMGYLIPIGIKPGSQDSSQDEADTAAQAAQDAEFVDYAARRMVDVVLTHRRRIARASELAERLFQELEEQTTSPEAFERMIEVAFMTPPDAGDGQALAMAALRGSLKQHLALGSRAKTLTNLASALQSLTKLERQAYGLSEAPEKGAADPIAIDREREQATTGKTPEELARAMLNLIERAARAKAEGRMQ